MSAALRDPLARLPKIDLHRHLEGAIRPATLAEIGRAHRLPLPTYDADELSRIVQLSEPVADLEAFFLPFKTLKFCFLDKEVISRLAYEAVEDAYLDNVRYLELRFSPEFMAFCHRLPLSEVMDGVVEGVELASRRFQITTKLIVSISRHLSGDIMAMPWPTPMDIVQLALDYADRGVVGLDLSGREEGFPPEMFAEPFEVARRAGLGITAHAGEETGAQSVRNAVICLSATRIGHGVRIARDAAAIRLIRERGVCLEICPTSNVLTHAVKSLATHPVRELYEAGLLVTINTDDPSVCRASLSDEYRLLVDRFGFTVGDLGQLVSNAERAAFARAREAGSG